LSSKTKEKIAFSYYKCGDVYLCDMKCIVTMLTNSWWTLLLYLFLELTGQCYAPDIGLI